MVENGEGFRCVLTGASWPEEAISELPKNGASYAFGWGCIFGFSLVGAK